MAAGHLPVAVAHPACLGAQLQPGLGGGREGEVEGVGKRGRRREKERRIEEKEENGGGRKWKGQEREKE